MSSPDKDDTLVYLVFGATGGIGSCLSRRLLQRGARLVVASRDANRLKVLADELGAEPYPVDATQFDETIACAEATYQRCGRGWRH